MSNRGKAYLFILVAMILISLSLAGGVFYLLQQEKAKAVKLKDRLEDITSKYEVTKKEKQFLAKKFKSAINYLSSYSRIEAKSRIQMQSLQDSLRQQEALRQTMEKEMTNLKLSMERLQLNSAGLMAKFNEANATLKKTELRLNEALIQKTALEKTVESLRAQGQKVELGTIVVDAVSESGKQQASSTSSSKITKSIKAGTESISPAPVVTEQPAIPQEAVSGAGLEGKVLVINKDYNFAVVNLGIKDGIKLGDIFAVYHNNAYLGDVKVEKIHDSMSAAGFALLEDGIKISEGDKVVLKR